VTTFVLVHGAWHGPSCWDRLVPELEQLGHQAVAVDLPSSAVEASTMDYVAAIEKQIEDPAETVLVAHSLSGLVAPLVAARLPLRELVFLAALLPLPGKSWRDQLAVSRPMAPEFYDTFLPRQRKDDDGRSYWDGADAAELFYHDCTPDDAALATTKLRPQASTPLAETTPLTGPPRVACRYIVCDKDRAVSPVWAAQAAVDRFGAAVTHLDSSHSPFWSRPAELAGLLVHGQEAPR
jgi:pimeloyl-ACP methyl ester carboxylesterase